jgi:cell division septal protein FtsQ
MDAEAGPQAPRAASPRAALQQKPKHWSRETRRKFIFAIVIFALGAWVTLVVQVLFLSTPLKGRMARFGKHPTGQGLACVDVARHVIDTH